METSTLVKRNDQVRQTLAEMKGKKDQLETSIKKNQQRIEQLDEEITQLLTASQLLSKATEAARESGKLILEQTVSNIVQMVFGDDYEVVIELDTKRQNPTADVFIKKRIGLEDQLINVNHEGGGIRDVISLAFFAAICHLTGSENKALITLDEPTPAVSAGNARSVAEAIQLLMNYLGKQSIIITHEREFLPTMIDKVYFVSQSADGVSKVDEL